MISSNTGDAGSTSTPTPDANKDVKTAHTDEEQQKLDELIAQWTEMTFEESEIPELAQKVLSGKSEDLLYGLIGLRKVLTQEDGSQIQAVIDTDIVPRLVRLISPEAARKIQLEAAWCLANLCSGTTEQTQYVIENGVISSFVSLLSSDDEEVADQSIWGLGNIAADSGEFRDLILKQNAIKGIVKFLAKASKINMKRSGIWTLSNLCRVTPLPKFKLVSKAIPCFCEYIIAETDTEILKDALWGLSYHTNADKAINLLLSSRVVPKLIELFSHKDVAVQVPSLRIIGNIITGSEEQTSVVLKEKNFIPELFKLVETSDENIRRDLFWTLSNITVGTPIQSEAIMGNPTYVKEIIHAAKNEIKAVKREAVWTLSNSTKNCAPAQIVRILNNGVFGCLVDLLDEQDPKVLGVTLEGINNCLKWGEQFNIKDESGVNKFVAEIESKDAVGKIENLQSHENQKVCKYALKILEKNLL